MAINISVFLFAVALLTSKSLITLMAVILILWAFIAKSQRQLWTKNKKVITIIALLPLALVVSLLSLGGWQSALAVIKSWSWPLLAAPAFCIYHNKILTDYFKKGLLLGLVLAVGYSMVNLALALNSEITAPFMSDNFRITSFWDISRWGFFSGIATLILFFTWHQLSQKRPKVLIGTLLIFTAVSFALTNTRATAVAALAALVFFAATDRRMIKTLLLGLAIGSVFIFLTPKFQQRLQSIFAVNIKDGKISSEHASNAGRFTMWKVALDFFQEQPVFGTGFDNTKQPLKTFLDQKNSKYLENYQMAEFSYNDQHSSYISMLVQMGVLYFVIFWGLIFYWLTAAFRKYRQAPDKTTQLLLAGLIYCGFIFIFYSSVNSFEAIAFFIMLTVLGESQKKLPPIPQTNL